MRMSGPGFLPTERPHVDNSSLRLAQCGNAMLRDQERATDVRGKHPVPLGLCDLFKLKGLVDPCVVDQYVNLAESIQNLADGVGDTLTVGDIARNRKPLP